MAEIVINKTIDPLDHMYNTGASWYFQVGEEGLRAVRRVLNLSDNCAVRKVLDLACGHGRVARYLRAGFPDAQLFYCDIDIQAAEFCAKTFGGKAIASKEELTQVSLPSDCDVIWVGSLFTHLDRNRTERFLTYLCRFLAEEGVLVATFHGAWSKQLAETSPFMEPERWATVLEGYSVSGYGYRQYSHLKDDFGVSLSRPSVIVEMVERIPGVRLLAYMERGWGHNHDVLGVSGTDRLKPW